MDVQSFDRALRGLLSTLIRLGWVYMLDARLAGEAVTRTTATVPPAVTNTPSASRWDDHNQTSGGGSMDDDRYVT